MSWFERFTSRKGKSDKAIKPAKVVDSKKSSATEQEKKIFAAVSSGKSAPKETKEQTIAPAKSVSEKKSPGKAPTKAPEKTSTHQANRVLLNPVITEKSTFLGRQNQYVFAIAPLATKIDVRRAVQHVYGIRPTAVAIVRLPGKDVRYGRTFGRTAARKKAVVTLPTGKSIDLTVS